MSWPFRAAPAHASADAVLKDHRERLALEQREKAERRSHELSEQSSSLNTPETRIRMWERVHGLSLPRDPSHPVLDVIAAATRLTLDEVREEQRLRTAYRTVAAAAATKAAAPGESGA